MVSLALVVAAIGVAEPLVTKYIFDALGTTQPLQMLAYGIGGLIVLEVARMIMSGGMSILTWDVRLKIDHRLREAVYGKIYALPIGYHRNQRVGGLVNKVNQSLSGFLNTAMGLCTSTLPSLVFLVLSLVTMLNLEWRLSLVVIAFLPVPTLIGAWAAREQADRERKLIESWSHLYSRLHETLSSILTVKGFVREQAELRQFLDGSRDGNAIVYHGVRRDTVTNGARNFAGTLARIAAIGVGAYFIAEGDMTVGTLVAFLGYIGGLMGPVQGLTGTYQSIRRCGVSLEVIYEILDADDAGRDGPGVKKADGIAGSVAFRNVSFAYPGGDAVLSDFSLEAEPGDTIALVGPSGSGKTTLINLLQRHYDVSDGSIHLDGTDIREMAVESLRRTMGTVFQDVQLFNDTVHANIAFGRPDAGRKAVERAAIAAQADGFIMNLPQGYDTIIGEQGSRLSGGQKQRVAIARALLLDPPILILDEATSALDAESEAAVHQALRTIIQGRTTFVIAHRMSTVREADRIVVMRHGKIEAEGTHEELMASNVYYARIIRLQTNGILSFDDAMRAA